MSVSRFRFFALLVFATILVPLLLYTNNATLNDWLMGLFTYAIAVAAVLALFQDWVRSLIWSPDLRVIIEPGPPDSHKTNAYYGHPQDAAVQFEAPCYYYRFRVHNVGRAAAHSVEVYVAVVERETSTGDWATVDRFIPQHLSWSLLGQTIYLPILPPKAVRSCDLGSVLGPEHRQMFHETENDENVPAAETIFSLACPVKALRRGHLLPRGKYRIKLEIAASNAAPKTFTVTMSNPGAWHDDEEIMLRDGVAVRLEGTPGVVLRTRRARG